MIPKEGKKTKDNAKKNICIHMGICSIREAPTYSEGSGQSANSSRFLGNLHVYIRVVEYAP
jgi:hypothetical protein